MYALVNADQNATTATIDVYSGRHAATNDIQSCAEYQAQSVAQYYGWKEPVMTGTDTQHSQHGLITTYSYKFLSQPSNHPAV